MRMAYRRQPEAAAARDAQVAHLVDHAGGRDAVLAPAGGVERKGVVAVDGHVALRVDLGVAPAARLELPAPLLVADVDKVPLGVDKLQVAALAEEAVLLAVVGVGEVALAVERVGPVEERVGRGSGRRVGVERDALRLLRRDVVLPALLVEQLDVGDAAVHRRRRARPLPRTRGRRLMI